MWKTAKRYKQLRFALSPTQLSMDGGVMARLSRSTRDVLTHQGLFV